ncbi:MAG TPA: spore germination protein, partial [Clostridiaceae bacterium]|nr:spore germination protein [Clostridiaceae bacterium]
RSKTDIAIMYIDDIVDKRILDELNKRLDNINIDSVIDSGYIQQFIEDRAFTFLPEVQATERPDTVAASIYEGRVAILVDNSPQALIIPVTIQSFLQSPEDYYTKPIIATFTRILRSFAAIISVIAPAFYIAVTSYHQDMIPNKLAISIAASREGVPFPAYMETLIMIIILELLLEAGIRLPRPIGSTIGIVGGLIIGQAAVSAGIVSPIMIIVVAFTAVASFAIPNYEFAASARIMRLIFMLGASIFGLYGIMLVFIGIMIHMVNLKSFGVPYLAPFAPFEKEDMKDSLFYRGPWKRMRKRPIQLNPNDLIRQGKK